MIISLVGQKGGTSKSTIAICLAVELQVRGSSVLIIDADEQGTASTWGVVAQENGNPAPDIRRAITCEDLEKVVHESFDRYDYIFIDLPSELREVPRAALILSDVALTPCAPSPTEMWSLQATVDVIREAKEKNPELRVYGVQARVQSNTKAGRTFKEDLTPWGIKILHCQLGLRIAYKDALAAGYGVTNYPASGDGQAATEIENLVGELCARIRNGDRDVEDEDGDEANA